MIRLENISWTAPGKAVRLSSTTFRSRFPRRPMRFSWAAPDRARRPCSILCGLRAPASGSVRIDEREATALPPGERGIGYVPQDGALFPTLTVREQIAFGLRMRGVPSAEIEACVLEAAKGVGVGTARPDAPGGFWRRTPARRSRTRPRREAFGAAPRRTARLGRRGNAGRPHGIASTDPARAPHHLLST